VELGADLQFGPLDERKLRSFFAKPQKEICLPYFRACLNIGGLVRKRVKFWPIKAGKAELCSA
jgi:hypothetical protein